MLDEYFKRDDVLNLIQELKTNDYYYQKNHSFFDFCFPVSSELALYIFYDALLKYKIIVDDDALFAEYVDQISKLYRKLDDFERVRFGIHKLLARMVSIKHELHDWKRDDREELISFIYDKYITHGYLFHGLNSSYKEAVRQHGFVPEYYENYYEEFQKVNTIFAKYGNYVAFMKDFSSKHSVFTDDSLLGCYYSMCSPMFFFHFLTNSEIFGKKTCEEHYFIDDYLNLIRPLKKFMSNSLFREKDKEYVFHVVKEEWDILQRGDKELCLLCVPRKKIISKEVPLEKYFKLDQDVFEVIDRILSSKYNNINVYQMIPSDQIQIATFPHYYRRKADELKKKESESKEIMVSEKKFLNAYGSASIMMLLGIVFVTAGIILSIIGIGR